MVQNKSDIESQIFKSLKTVYDPEIPVNIYELGLVYEIEINDSFLVNIKMTLTSPNCPVAEILPVEVQDVVNKIPGVKDTHVEIVWEPTWTPDMMSDAAKLELGML